MILPCGVLGQAPSGGPARVDASSAGRLYGEVTTTDARTLRGMIRWDRSEGSWIDVHHGTRRLDPANQLQAEELGLIPPEIRQRSVEYRGHRITWEEDLEVIHTEVGVRFGHLRSIVPTEGGRAILSFKGGHELELMCWMTEAPGALRGLMVEVAGGEVVEIDRDEVERVDFRPPPGSGTTRGRLRGTVTDVAGHTYRGLIAWDQDEAFGDDELEGEDEDGDDVVVRFDRIARIERLGTRASRVFLRDGPSLTLSGSNDVDSSNRGIVVSDPGLGGIELPWRAVASVAFDAAGGRDEPGYDDFDGGRKIRGTVRTEGGAQLSGVVRWDNDEEYTWEMLDGSIGDADLDIEISRIARISKISPAESEVTLLDGRVLRLDGSNDVDQLNKGVFVLSDEGRWSAVSWADFKELVLDAGGPRE